MIKFLRRILIIFLVEIVRTDDKKENPITFKLHSIAFKYFKLIKLRIRC